MKRISTERITNPELTGRRDNPELAAMYAIWQASIHHQRENTMAICNNCGRGDDVQMMNFTCQICGAHNNADGSVEYDGSRDAVDRMEDRIRDYDDRA